MTPSFTGLTAAPDLVGGRIVLRWGWALEPGDTLADIPAVAIRRRTHDLAFADDALPVYDTTKTLPGTLTELELAPIAEPGRRTVVHADSIARTDLAPFAGVPMELARITTATTRDLSGQPLEQTRTLLDAGLPPFDSAPASWGLDPVPVQYYALSWTDGDGGHVATAGARVGVPHGHGALLYDLLPEVHRRLDTVARPADAPSAPGIPEAAPRSGQLRRLLDVAGASFDAVRSTADGLRTLRDTHDADLRFLGLIAQGIGWPLDVKLPVARQRHQLRYAAGLYRETGTIPGCLIWVKRLTGWDCRLREFARNVFFSNDLGNPDDPTDRGSRSADCSDPVRLATLGTVDDDFDYTYDTGTGRANFYAFNVVGIFVDPGSDPRSEITRKRALLLGSTHLWLPLNMRAVVIFTAPTQRGTATEGGGLDGIGEELAA
jgi:hypothetical protein